MSQFQRSILVLCLLVSLHTAAVLLAWRLLRHAMLTPVVLSVPDVLLGEDEPLEARAIAFHALTWEPVSGVPLRFVVEGEPSTALERLVETGEQGRASVVLGTESAKGDAAAAAGSRIAVSIAEGSPFVLASRMRQSGVGPKRVVAEVYPFHPGTAVLVVDLGSRGSGAWPFAPPFVERVTEESRARPRTIYASRLEERDRDRTRFLLDAAGLPEGPLVISIGEDPSASGVSALARRLAALEAKVEAVLCDPEQEPAYTQSFPGVRVMGVEQ